MCVKGGGLVCFISLSVSKGGGREKGREKDDIFLEGEGCFIPNVPITPLPQGNEALQGTYSD